MMAHNYREYRFWRVNDAHEAIYSRPDLYSVVTLPLTLH